LNSDGKIPAETQPKIDIVFVLSVFSEPVPF